MKQLDIELLNEVYKGCQMGVDSIGEILPKIADSDMITILNEHRSKLMELQKKVVTLASEQNDSIEKPGMVSQLMLKGETKMNIMMDESNSHFAEMLIQGSTMGVTGITRLLRKSENYNAEVKKLAESLVRLEEHQIEKMKQYL